MKYYICCILFVVYLPIAELTWPSEPGCNVNFDYQQCLLQFYCFDSMTWNTNLNYFSDFRQLLETDDEYWDANYFKNNCYDGTNKVNYVVFYRSRCDTSYDFPSEAEDQSISLYDYNKIQSIKIFDMSDQNCYFIPNLSEMSQVYYLNFANNFISEAKLYNNASLNSLTKVDYSYNVITHIDVSGERKFSNINWLNISHNQLESLPDAIFEIYSELINLDLSYNHIDKLQLMTFEGIKGLTYLNLSNNNIKDVNSSMGRFKKLKILNLSFNKIETINSQDFMHLENLEILDISFNSIVTIDKTSFNGMPSLNYLSLAHNLVEMLDEDLFITNNMFVTIDISDNHIHTLPKNLFKNNSVSFFYIMGNKLEGSLEKGTFDGLTFVTELSISNQLLTSIDDYAFFGIKSLEQLILNNNNIKSLSKHCFRNLFHLTYLNLSDNNITNIDFEKDDLVSLQYLSLENNFLKQIGHDDFGHIKALNFLNLDYNNIAGLEAKIFKSLHNLRNLEISKNPLNGTIQEGTFDGLQSLPALDISGTKLTKLSNNSFSGMYQLNIFNVSHSLIHTLQFNTFANTSEIKTIDLSYNKLASFMLNPIYLLKLSELLLNDNMLIVISDISFSGLSSLKNIDLSNNYIHTISNNAFIDQTDLKYLKLSFNSKMHFDVSIIKYNFMLHEVSLSGLNHGINFSSNTKLPITSLQIEADGIKNIRSLNLELMPQLENIDLEYNNIRTVNVGELSDFAYLKNLDLSHNEIMFIQPGVFEYNTYLIHLNISHNYLKELNYGIFKGLIQLEILDVSFNSLYDLKNERFYELQSLEKLIVDHNNIDSFNALDFNGLKLLSIGENPLPCEILINLDKTPLPFQLTAIHIVKNEENFHGITCNKNKKSRPTLNSNHTQVIENNEVLFEIRDELVRIANENKLQKNNAPTNDLQSKDYIGEWFNKMMHHVDENFSQLTNFSAMMVKGTNDTNNLLLKIMQNFNTNKSTTTSVPYTKDNAAKDNILPYINKVKKELEDLMSSERESIMKDINSRLSAINASIEHTKLTTISSTYKTSTQMSLQKLNNNAESKSVFTEVCVGLILCILVGYILYTFYKSKLFIRPRRTSSTRELESQNL